MRLNHVICTKKGTKKRFKALKCGKGEYPISVNEDFHYLKWTGIDLNDHIKGYIAPSIDIESALLKPDIKNDE